MSKPPVRYNSLLHALARSSDVRGAQGCFEEMKDAAIRPDAFSRASLIRAASAKPKGAAEAEALLEKFLLESTDVGLVGYSAVVDAFAKAGMGRQARKWFGLALEARLQPDVVMYNSVINSCTKEGRQDDAEHWLRSMLQHAMSPDRVSFNSVLDAAARSGQGDASIELSSRMLESMSSSSIPPDMISYNAAIRACVRAGAAESAADFVAALRGDGLHPDDATPWGPPVSPSLPCIVTVLWDGQAYLVPAGLLRWRPQAVYVLVVRQRSMRHDAMADRAGGRDELALNLVSQHEVHDIDGFGHLAVKEVLIYLGAKNGASVFFGCTRQLLQLATNLQPRIQEYVAKCCPTATPGVNVVENEIFLGFGYTYCKMVQQLWSGSETYKVTRCPLGGAGGATRPPFHTAMAHSQRVRQFHTDI
ncbi:Pentatricopeptide repeat-containing protein, chloroplastic [Symbiodinium microadriaticum]|uniref:Pentatricopeptide repeat-containing protein, chloroplastic n=1 Tax=Symbiodinium microadriaticum TaxID=2951 RepID=A0A1Q9DGD5_SYMMI|nr:Pentatricopeptide repeat-containing protein, chloroplastic [Symbiodinium microadriaticum]